MPSLTILSWAVVYALIGMEFYQGILDNKCFVPSTDGTATLLSQVSAAVLVSTEPTGLAWNQTYFLPSSNSRSCDTAGKGYTVCPNKSTVASFLAFTFSILYALVRCRRSVPQFFSEPQLGHHQL